MVPPRKVLGIEVVPLNRKMTKYTGPTQDTNDDRVFNNWKKKNIFFYLGWDQCTFLGGTI